MSGWRRVRCSAVRCGGRRLLARQNRAHKAQRIQVSDREGRGKERRSKKSSEESRNARGQRRSGAARPAQHRAGVVQSRCSGR